MGRGVRTPGSAGPAEEGITTERPKCFSAAIPPNLSKLSKIRPEPISEWGFRVCTGPRISGSHQDLALTNAKEKMHSLF